MAAVPPANVEVPNMEIPSKKLTFPVADAGDTVAVKVTADPSTEAAAGDTESATEDGVLPARGPAACGMAASNTSSIPKLVEPAT